MLFSSLFLASGVLSQAPKTWCNPLSIPDMPLGIVCRDVKNGTPIPEKGWRHDFWLRSACKFTTCHQFRELADPVVYVEGSRWYLYPSAGLMWTSDDCGGTWKREAVRAESDYAPAVAKFRGKYYLCTSGGPLSVADSPTGPFKTLGKFDMESFGPKGEVPWTGDPALLADGDRLYLYWGCCSYPEALWGVELDPENPLKAKVPGSAKCLMEYDEKKYPWLIELIEGPWVFKRGDTYYLTYATDNTANAGYRWCASKSSSPLGPFVPQKNNPFFITEKGLSTGTSHGSIWRDASGDWWINHCVIVGAYFGFERMIAQDRIDFEPNGDIAVRTGTDTPQWLPSSGRKGDTGWKALACTNAPTEAVDGSLHTWWIAGTAPVNGVFDFGGVRNLRSYRLIWRDLGLDTLNGVIPGPYRYRVDYRSNGVWWTWVDASDNKADLLVDYREGPEVEADAVRLAILGAPAGITPAVVEFTVFGF